MLKIRKFVPHEDEGVWTSLWNRAFNEFWDFRSLSVEDMMTEEKSPSFNSEGMYIAELDGKPVGVQCIR